MGDLNTWLLAFIALCNMLTPLLWIRVGNIRRDMRSLERNTNSKMDQLLKVTSESEHAKGVLQGKKESDKK